MTATTEDLRAILERARGARVLVIGDLMLDEYIWGNVERVSPEAPVQVLEWVSHHDGLGGAANVAQNLVALGCEVWLLGVVGNDDKGVRLREIVAQQGIHDDILVDTLRPTTSKLRVMAGSQQMLRIDREQRHRLGDEQQQTLIERLAARLGEVDGIICSDYGKGVLTREVLSAARRLAQGQSKMVLADPKGTDYTRYMGFDVVTPNRKELEAAAAMPAANDHDIVAAGTKILNEIRGAALLVTRGRDGMTLLRSERPPVHIASAAREVFDVTGAGDTVIAAFAMAVFRGTDLEPAAQLANTAAGLEVAKIGAAPVTHKELQTELEGGPHYEGTKILGWPELQRVVSRARGQGRRVVFTNGCFDILHVGHIELLRKARALGDVLVVGLNSDASIRGLKGEKRPLIGHNERAHVLAALDAVDYVTLFEEDTPLKLIELLHPDVLVKGGDYSLDGVVGRDLVESYGGHVVLVPVVEGFSTTELLRRIVERHTP